MIAREPLRFGTKAETLERVAPRLGTARVLPQVRFTVRDWRADPAARIASVRERGWLAAPAIVRSSALREDGDGASLAGRYPSVAGCVGEARLRDAIDEVASALDDADGRDQVFVQPQLEAVRSSGVLLTRDPSGGGRYAIVSYEEFPARSDGITSGRAAEPRTYFFHETSPDPPDPLLAGVLALGRELQELLATEALDVEYALDADGVLYLFQVRPLHVPAEEALDEGTERRAVLRLRQRIEELARPHPYLHGTRAPFGSMPDWNPAEVLGARPRSLALSLYRELVTDGIWAYQRSNYGYRNLRSFPLVVSFAGLPYVDVRVSFNSFLPADLDEDLGRRLVEEYVRRLLASPPDHDKIEFSIVYSCYSLDLPRRLESLAKRGFDRSERERLAASLRALTNRITAGGASPFRKDLERIAELERRQAAFAVSGRDLDPASRIYWLLEDCKRYGTLPFAGIARAAFIAVQLLDSLVAAGVLERGGRERFLRSLRTVRAGLDRDLLRLPREAFLRRYGHLRPGTYDITSPRYDETPEAYFDWGAPATRAEGPAEEPFALSAERGRRLDALLAEHGLQHDHASLLAFLRDAIEGREAAKFVFSRSLSDALAALADLGRAHGFTREDLAHADVEVVRHLHAGTDDPRQVLEASIRAGRSRFVITRRLHLPPLVTGPSDACAFHLPPSEPSFVTQGRAEGHVVLPESGERSLRAGIVMIPSADPGWDWVFTHAVAGLVTLYGGYNSHMAIRAGELGIPAVIGAGESLFRAWAAARVLRIDCLDRRVEVLG